MFRCMTHHLESPYCEVFFSLVSFPLWEEKKFSPPNPLRTFVKNVDYTCVGPVCPEVVCSSSDLLICSTPEPWAFGCVAL